MHQLLGNYVKEDMAELRAELRAELAELKKLHDAEPQTRQKQTTEEVEAKPEPALRSERAVRPCTCSVSVTRNRFIIVVVGECNPEVLACRSQVSPSSRPPLTSPDVRGRKTDFSVQCMLPPAFPRTTALKKFTHGSGALMKVSCRPLSGCVSG